MSDSVTDVESQKAIELTRQAHVAELAGDYKQAYNFHFQASNLLVNVVAKGKKKSEERRRAKLQLRAANDRVALLRETTGNPPPPLPSLAMVERELMGPMPGTVLLTPTEMRRSATLSETPGLQQQPLQILNLPLLTPLLSPSLPDVTYHIYSESFRRYPNFWFYFHVKDSSKTQTLYTISAMRRTGYQIPICTMARAAEYHTTCASIIVTPVRPPDRMGGIIGRPLKILTGTQTVILDAPDRLEKDSWTPRRFTYGGRRFVWKKGKGALNVVDSLYEVEKEWPDPNSKTGKFLDQTQARPLVWGESKWAIDKICTLHMVGGLDQMFRELLLASQITRQLIHSHGHRK